MTEGEYNFRPHAFDPERGFYDQDKREWVPVLAASVVPPLREGNEKLREDADSTEQHGENPTGRLEHPDALKPVAWGEHPYGCDCGDCP